MGKERGGKMRKKEKERGREDIRDRNEEGKDSNKEGKGGNKILERRGDVVERNTK